LEWCFQRRAPGIFISYNTEDEIHTVLQTAPALPVGLNLGVIPAASALNLKNW